MPSVEAKTSLPAARRGRPVALKDAIRAACGLYFADEALSSLRHNLLNRLTAMGALSFELRRTLDPPREEVRDRLDDLNRQIGLICESVARRLAPGRSDPPRCSIREVVEAVAAASPGRLELPPATAPRLLAAIEPVALGVALLCLVENARESASGRSTPRVAVVWRVEEDERIAIEVNDDGSGLEAAAEMRAFERFFSTKVGHAGLGLCVARTLAVRALGELRLDSRTAAGGGTCATLLLPAAPRRGKAERG